MGLHSVYALKCSCGHTFDFHDESTTDAEGRILHEQCARRDECGCTGFDLVVEAEPRVVEDLAERIVVLERENAALRRQAQADIATINRLSREEQRRNRVEAARLEGKF
jgi:hypothetical protein